MGRHLVRGSEDARKILLLPELGSEFAVLKLEREHALLEVGHDVVETVGELLAVGDALFQLLTGSRVFVAHVSSVAHGAGNGEGLHF